MTSALEGDEGSASSPGRTSPPVKTRYPLYRRLGGPQGRSGLVRKISPPTGIRSPDRPARRQSLYRLRYPAHDDTRYSRHITYVRMLLTVTICQCFMSGWWHTAPIFYVHCTYICTEEAPWGLKNTALCANIVNSWNKHFDERRSRVMWRCTKHYCLGHL